MFLVFLICVVSLIAFRCTFHHIGAEVGWCKNDGGRRGDGCGFCFQYSFANHLDPVFPFSHFVLLLSGFPYQTLSLSFTSVGHYKLLDARVWGNAPFFSLCRTVKNRKAFWRRWASISENEPIFSTDIPYHYQLVKLIIFCHVLIKYFLLRIGAYS